LHPLSAAKATRFEPRIFFEEVKFFFSMPEHFSAWQRKTNLHALKKIKKNLLKSLEV